MTVSKRATIRDVASLAKVSDMTVSRVVHGSPLVTEETRRAVTEAIEALGYNPDGIAQNMRRRRSNTIGFIIPDLTNITNATVAQAIESEIAAAGYQLLIVSTQSDRQKELSAIKLLKGQRVAAAVILISDEHDTEVLDAIASIGVPVVMLDRDTPLNVDAVLSAHREPMAAAVDYLAALGHQKIAGILPPKGIRAGRLRSGAILSKAKDKGLTIASHYMMHADPVIGEGRRLALALLDSGDPPTAIIVGTNQLTLGVMQAIRERGLTIPDDISVIGSDDIVTSAILTPPLTIVWRDMAAFGHKAAELLLSRLEGYSGPARKPILPSELLLRHSCGLPRQ